MAGILGFVREGLHGGADDEEEGAEEDGGQKAKEVPRRVIEGFGVTASVDGDRPSLGPVLIPCNLGEGGVQGLRWYARQFLIDEDGDAADEFLNEISLPENQITQTQTAAKFEINYLRPLGLTVRGFRASHPVSGSNDAGGRFLWRSCGEIIHLLLRRTQAAPSFGS